MGEKPKTVLGIGGGIADVHDALELGDIRMKVHHGGSSER